MIEELRCLKCRKKLGEKLSGKVEIVCPRCGHFNVFLDKDLTKVPDYVYPLDKVKAP